MNRRTFLQGAAGPVGQAAKPSPSRPNVLLLISDQHRPDLLSCRGADIVATPNLDRIASRGVRFDRAYCPTPVCVPSRMSLLTGLYPHRHGAVDNSRTLPWRTGTIAHHFRDHGYLTGLIGKMHFHDAHTHGFDYHIGFNDWHAYLGPKLQSVANENHSNWLCGRTLNCDGCGFPEQPALVGRNPWLGHVTRMAKLASDLPADDHFDAFAAREAAKFLRRYRHEPFFLTVGFLKPHAPFHPPEEWADRLYDPVRMPLRPVGDRSQYPASIQREIAAHQKRGETTLRFRRAGQMGCLAFLDYCAGQVYRALEELGLAQNTIVVYTSDHGEMDGEHGLYEKGVLFEPSAGVPLIVSHPGSLPEGRVSGGLVEYTGLYPTLADLCGLPVPGGLDVRSFAAQARRPESGGLEAVHGAIGYASGGRYMVRTRRFKYVYNDNGRAELYDLEPDPGENRNLEGLPSFSRVRSEMHERLTAWFDPAKNPFARAPR